MATLAPRSIAASRRASALYCEVHGSGTPLLLVHGIGASGAVFQPLLPRLAARYQVIVPDLRGHGHSRRLPGPDSVARLAADIENLLDMLGRSSCVLIGHATGGAVAQQVAHDYPDRVRGLALVCSYARGAATLREHVEARLRPELFRLLGSRSMAALAARGAPAGEAGFVHDVIAANHGGRVAPVARALLSFDSRSWLPELGCPALVVAGERDTTAPAHHARELARLIPRATLRILPHAGHWLVKTHADALVDALLPWLAELEVSA
ncbi:MAG: alpha/beta hydrolase [Kouleothrix sp.]|nr:alpha/beta hydrolase [Kouleothrix sp.]